jgi:hypothetical protein
VDVGALVGVDVHVGLGVGVLVTVGVAVGVHVGGNGCGGVHVGATVGVEAGPALTVVVGTRTRGGLNGFRKICGFIKTAAYNSSTTMVRSIKRTEPAWAAGLSFFSSSVDGCSQFMEIPPAAFRAWVDSSPAEGGHDPRQRPRVISLFSIP